MRCGGRPVPNTSGWEAARVAAAVADGASTEFAFSRVAVEANAVAAWWHQQIGLWGYVTVLSAVTALVGLPAARVVSGRRRVAHGTMIWSARVLIVGYLVFAAGWNVL